MCLIPDKSIDMILCDLPYGTTQNKWDSVIPLDKLWEQYLRVIKDNGAIVLTAQQPFTTSLINSNKNNFRYSLVWDKVGTTGFQNAKRMPLRRHEDICVFYKNLSIYNPQMEIRGKPRKKGGSKKDNGCYGKLRSSESFNNTYYPTSIISISNAVKIGKLHPTQKPVALFEYLIKTYTNEGETVLDNCMGSGTTAIACMNTNRNYIGFEWCPDEPHDIYFNLANKRIQEYLHNIKTT
jgi:site-specific DNA-methyltransferase (adenine-specific)